MSILKTKLYAPTLRRKIVSRPRLIGKLDRGLEMGRNLSLIFAPAGFGKTTLANDWISHCNRPFAWLSLDAEDSDPSRFLSYIVAALQTIDARIGLSITELLRTTAPNEAMLTTLINDIAGLSSKCILVLDDYQVVHSKEANQVLDFLLAKVSNHVHFLIISRNELGLPIARLRALDQVTEVAASELLFTGSETEAFLSKTMGLNLAPDIVTQFRISTEGWIAGLQLAAISTPGQKNLAQFSKSFGGATQPVFDFLFEEIFLSQAEQIQRFLISTASLQWMCGALCDAVMGDESQNSLETLNYLLRVNLFVVPLADDQQWFRYHHLLHDALRHLQARHLSEQEIFDIHLRASMWLEVNGTLADTFHHAIASKNWNHVARLAETCWEAQNQTFKSPVWLAWTKNIPEAVLCQRPVLGVQIAWAHMDAGDVELSEARLKLVELSMTHDSANLVIVEQAQFQNLLARIAFIRAYNAQNSRDTESTIFFAEQVLTLSPIEDNHFIRAQARAILAAAYWHRGDLDAASHALTEWVSNAKKVGNTFFAIAGSAGLAEILASQGHLADALGVYQQALLEAADTEGGASQIIAHHNLGIALLHHELGNDDAATAHLEKSIELGKVSVLPDWNYRRNIALAYFKDSDGEYDAALNFLNEAQRHHVPSLVPETQPVEALKARIYLKQGALQRAQTWVRKNKISDLDATSYLHEFEHLTVIRVAITALRDQADDLIYQDALRLLITLQASAEKQNRQRSQLEILKLKAQLYYANGDQHGAFETLEQLFSLAKPEGYLRTFVDEGQAMYAMLVAFRIKLSSNTKVGDHNTSYVDKVLSAFSKQVASLQSTFVEPLSQRELAVLKLLAEGHSNEEIGTRLFLALDTVKGHNRRIFTKLQVRRRTEAVVRAQKLGLL